MKKNILNGIYMNGNIMPLAAVEVLNNNGCLCGMEQGDEYKYDYIMPMELRVITILYFLDFILKYINDECDKYEYEDSPMFDELPDAMFVDGIVKRVAEKYNDEQQNNDFFVDKNGDLLIYALLIGVIVYRKNRHASIKSKSRL